ncbi:hypothetical protein ABZ714_01995 [Streptomyces sp. NPDC006798]|uniref:hypothetical protein n=1 Tax=Streptomyces sp. NPDC006798 TaxID=3155462 RepID=UPI003405A845
MTLLTIGIEQLVQWRYGVVAALGFTLLVWGVRTENATRTGIGGLLLIGPALSPGA